MRAIEEMQFGEKETVARLFVGKFHSFAFTTLGTIYSWGKGLSGQLSNNLYKQN